MGVPEVEGRRVALDHPHQHVVAADDPRAEALGVAARGVLRGIHYQVTRPQGKLVRVTAGSAFDVAVDLRRASPSFGQWVGVELSAANRRMLWVPPGFGHAFLTLEDGTDFLYKCTDFYAPEDEGCIRWDDPDLGIEWPLGGAEPTLSARDRAGVALSHAETYP